MLPHTGRYRRGANCGSVSIVALEQIQSHLAEIGDRQAVTATSTGLLKCFFADNRPIHTD